VELLVDGRGQTADQHQTMKLMSKYRKATQQGGPVADLGEFTKVHGLPFFRVVTLRLGARRSNLFHMHRTELQLRLLGDAAMALMVR